MIGNRRQYDLEGYYKRLMEDYKEKGETDHPKSLPYDPEVYQTLYSNILGGPWLWFPYQKKTYNDFSKGYKPFSDKDIKNYKYPGIVGRNISIDTIISKEYK